MRCENSLCIYFEDSECILSEISINTFGMCCDYISIYIEEDKLRKLRNQFLDKFEGVDF